MVKSTKKRKNKQTFLKKNFKPLLLLGGVVIAAVAVALYSWYSIPKADTPIPNTGRNTIFKGYVPQSVPGGIRVEKVTFNHGLPVKAVYIPETYELELQFTPSKFFLRESSYLAEGADPSRYLCGERVHCTQHTTKQGQKYTFSYAEYSDGDKHYGPYDIDVIFRKGNTFFYIGGKDKYYNDLKDYDWSTFIDSMKQVDLNELPLHTFQQKCCGG